MLITMTSADIISGKHIQFTYETNGILYTALNDISFSIKSGEFVVILGINGSGKTTLLKHINALLALQKGSLQVAQINVADKELLWELRQMCGIVFQNPDTQFVSSIIEEDIAFGLENYDTPQEKIPEKINKALQQVGLEGFEKRSTHSLSGGQKQRAALAGQLALNPDIILFDEVTSMLDPEGRHEILDLMKSLHKQKKTIISITHYVEEAIYADRVYLMKDGLITASGTPKEILTNINLMKKAELLPPLPVRMYNDLRNRGIYLSDCPLTDKELVKQLCLLK